MDFSAAYGVRMIQSLKPRHAEQSLALGLRQGVLTRAEVRYELSLKIWHLLLTISKENF